MNMPFQKGNKLGKRWQPGELVLITPLLRDYRHVYTKPEKSDTTESQRLIREVRDKDPKGFMAALERLEKAHTAELRLAATKTAAKQQKPSKEAAVEDAGHVRAADIIDQLLAEYKHGKVDQGEH
jgi:hypothetical protein